MNAPLPARTKPVGVNAQTRWEKSETRWRKSQTRWDLGAGFRQDSRDYGDSRGDSWKFLVESLGVCVAYRLPGSGLYYGRNGNLRKETERAANRVRPSHSAQRSPAPLAPHPRFLCLTAVCVHLSVIVGRHPATLPFRWASFVVWSTSSLSAGGEGGGCTRGA